MKSGSVRGSTRSRVPLFAMLALAATFGLAGCGGSVSKDSPGSGGSGGNGPPGPSGPPDVPIAQGGDVKNMGTGSGLTAQEITDIGALIVSEDTFSAAVATTCSSSGACATQPVVEFTVKTAHGGAVLGLAPSTLRLGVAKLVPPADGLASRWQSYINRTQNGTITTPPAALPSAVQANVETGAAAGWTELGGGKYRYVGAVNIAAVTNPIVVTYEPTLTHRVSIALNLASNAVDLDPDNPFRDFVPNGAPVTTEKLVAATKNCAACHVRFAEHGGSRRDVEYCDVCHNPATTDPDSGESVDLAYMAHSIHLGEHRSTPYIVYGFGNEEFNAGDITYPQPITFCENCHELSAATPQGDDWQTNPGAAACGGCHIAGLGKTGPSATTGMYTYTFTHPPGSLPPDFLTFNDGECKGCHKAGGSGGDIFEVHAQDPARKAIVNGKRFTYRILGVQNAAVGQAPSVTFQILQDGVPVDVKAITTGRLRLDFGWTTQDIHNIADIAGNAYQVDRGQAIVVDMIANMASVVDNGNGTYSYTLTQPLPSGFDNAVLGTGLMVVLEGRRVVDGSNAYPDSAYCPDTRPGSSCAIAGSTPRPQIVEPAKCNACHVQVSAHGGSRAGDPMICTICHGPSLGGTFGTDAFGPLALGAFLHGVHSGNVAPVGDVTYPHSLARCESCHVAGSFNEARPAALPMTMDAGTTLATGPAAIAWQDDLANSATAGTCQGCHRSAAAQTHMASQGGSFGVPKTLVPSASAEGCTFCHGPGRTFDTKVEHCNNLPLGQCVQ
jgi:OmcA/MtrC family decaheme c-type cytochrome